ncbi:MAG: glycoside hydrolase family 3 C-terminal domain-containing protein [Clostridiales bacterium]|nr:glycoside hydrolase family 3 C-terminal domain-containing protein [Clostridiales bacterium]
MILDGFREFNRLAAAEGAVLLKNDKEVLPIHNEKTAVFGRAQIDYYKSGAGSGGAVNTIYAVNILDGIRRCPKITEDEDIASWYENVLKTAPNPVQNLWSDNFVDCEPEIDEGMIRTAAKRNEKAVVVIGRLAGESYDIKNKAGGYLLTPNERRLISLVGKYFDKYAVLLNSGNIIDMKWIEEENVPCVMYIWHGGEEGGDAAADVLSGAAEPAGRLTDTIARDYSCYPSSANFAGESEIAYCEDIYVGYRWFETFDKDSVIYPFGFGLSYTSFEIICTLADKKDNIINLDFEVKNTGKYAGREVIQVYIEGKGAALSRPARELAAFAKTATINPGGTQKLTISINTDKTAAFDDTGVTGYKSAWVLEQGVYNIYAGKDVRNSVKVFSYEVAKTIVLEQLSQRMPVCRELERVINNNGKAEHEKITPALNFAGKDKSSFEVAGEYKGSFDEAVRDGKIREFAASLTDDELITLSRGEGMLSPKVTPGVASCFGGVSDELCGRGIPLAATADGPSGIRMDNGETASSMPCGMLLASTWDTDMVERLYEFAGKELVQNKIDMLLGPGMNIHRNPLCGRNFEYFSEDPLLTGMMGAACIRGIDKGGSAGVIKHFACNNKEYNRSALNSEVSERALREIYLRGFEIAVKTSPVLGIMTSYNLINGLHSASNYDLTCEILRNEWGYDGLVMTDWWAKMNYHPEDEGDKTKLGAMISAQNDLYMVVENFKAPVWKDDAHAALKEGKITRDDLLRNAVNILNVLSKLLCFYRKYGFKADTKPKNPKWFEKITQPREYNTIECPIPQGIKQKKPYVYVGVTKVNEKPALRVNTQGQPGDEMKFTVYTEKTDFVRLNLTVKSDASELAQFAVYARVNDKEYPIPFCGTNNSEIQINVEFELSLGYHELILAFANSNAVAATISEIHIHSV